ncbi:hypothetical protein HPB52_009731 [Rhipicephalus sanguineus]|uniref:Uncharacterized protein n=1 Tax=Rhipicephalus sanguineus TaxID=34632 RepID=A0A9D4T971_RHISA|nr:hypothetical protein HPB52_009731 [Rhipicephalus sanguineus]
MLTAYIPCLMINGALCNLSSPSNYNDVKLKLLQEGGLEFRDADMLYPADPTAQVVSYAAGPLQPLPPHEDVYGSTQLGAIMDLQQQQQPQHVQASQVQDHEPKKKNALDGKQHIKHARSLSRKPSQIIRLDGPLFPPRGYGHEEDSRPHQRSTSARAQESVHQHTRRRSCANREVGGEQTRSARSARGPPRSFNLAEPGAKRRQPYLERPKIGEGVRKRRQHTAGASPDNSSGGHRARCPTRAAGGENGRAS